MKRMLTRFLDAAYQAQWWTVCLPEVFLTVVACFWFMSDLPKAGGADLRPQKIALYLSYLLVCALLKLFLFFKVLRGREGGRLSWDYISFFLAMIELGWFFDLYIVGYSAQRSFWVIADYTVYWYIPLGVIFAAGCAVTASRNYKKLPVIGKLWYKKQRKLRRAGGDPEAVPPSKLKIFAGKWDAFTRNPLVPAALLLLYVLAGAALFYRFRSVSSANLAALNTRNKLCEGIKLPLFGLLYLFRRVSSDTRQRGGISRAAAAWLSFLAVVMTAGMYLLASEAGSAIIMVLFAIFMTVYFFSRRWGFVLAEMTGAVYLTGWLMERSFRTDGYPMLLTDTLGLERWNRLYHLEAFPQVLEMRSVLRQSPLLRGLISYNVPMTGKPFTRVEDFSYLNMVTVFGSLAALCVIFYYLMLLGRVFFRLDGEAAQRKITPQQRDGIRLAQYMVLYILTHALVHVVSNLAFLFFTGVPLPFVSKGLSNLLVVLLFSVWIVYILTAKKPKPAA